MRVRVPTYESFRYKTVYTVTEWRNGLVYKTKHLGYARDDRPPMDGEVYGSISTTMTRGKTHFTIELMEGGASRKFEEAV